MSDQAEPPTPPPAVPAGRSKKLTIAVVVLLLLPLVLPFPFYGLEQLWIAPLIDAKMLACASYACSGDALDLECLAWLLILGPSILAALAAVLLGVIGLQVFERPTSPKNDVLIASFVFGVLWLIFLGLALVALAVLVSL